MERAVKSIVDRGDKFDSDWCRYLSPLGWEHIGLTGDYIWKRGNKENA